MPQPLILRLSVIGVGLIGGSLARALRLASAVGEVVGCGRNEQNLALAVELGVIDKYHIDPTIAVRGADMVVLAVPLGMIEPLLRQIAPHVPAHCVITDVGSAKACVIADVQKVYGTILPYFVAGHPIAGTEKSGVEASFATLFQGRRVVLTPTQETAPEAVELVSCMWRLAGAIVSSMDAIQHDRTLAGTSHLPHLLAYALVDTLAQMGTDTQADIFPYAAGGFRDFTRIASSDPIMWRDICLANREGLLQLLSQFNGKVAELTDAITAGDGQFLLDTFTRAKQTRDTLSLD